MKIRLTPAAEADVVETYSWYWSRGDRLGVAFLDALDACMQSILENPLAFPKVHREIRRTLLRRFPYCVFYLVEETEVVILACLHGRRAPKVWQSRLET